jgi:acetyl-CoA carboxylase biotin carboxyl carrier protein
LDAKELKEILRILEDRDITEFELEQDGMKLRICRSGRGAAPSPAASVLPSAPAAATAPAPPPPGSLALAPTAAEGTTANEAIVKSPIVGTFYRATDPNSAPFVNVGDNVRVGQVLCIIEAMKLMNEIEAEVAGEVLKVHPDNGQPVQYGDPLFTVRPS